MPEVPSPDQNLESSLPVVAQGDDVYAHMPERGTPLKHGVVAGTHGPDAWVATSEGTHHRVHRSNIFALGEVAATSADLMFEHPAGEEVHVSKAIQEVVDHPIAGDELSTRLGIQAMERYITPRRTAEELGIRPVEELMGGPEQPGSNRWKIEELVAGIKGNAYHEGANNDLNLLYPSRDLEVMPREEATEVQAKISEINRHVLDTLYDEYGADFEHAVVFERTQRDGREQITVIPTQDAGFCFVERSYAFNTTTEESPQVPLPHVAIVVGKPDYSVEDGYLPAV